MTGRREKQKEETRRHLLETARELFLKKGFEKTTIRGIAKAAGVAPGTVFVHFPDKLTLLASTLVEEIDEGMRKGWETLPEKGLKSQLLHLASSLYCNYAREPELSKVLIRESAFVEGVKGEEMQSREMEFMNRIATLFESAQQLDEFRDDVSPMQGAMIFFSHYLFVLYSGFQMNNLGTEEQLAMLELLLKPLLETP